MVASSAASFLSALYLFYRVIGGMCVILPSSLVLCKPHNSTRDFFYFFGHAPVYGIGSPADAANSYLGPVWRRRTNP